MHNNRNIINEMIKLSNECFVYHALSIYLLDMFQAHLSLKIKKHLLVLYDYVYILKNGILVNKRKIIRNIYVLFNKLDDITQLVETNCRMSLYFYTNTPVVLYCYMLCYNIKRLTSILFITNDFTVSTIKPIRNLTHREIINHCKTVLNIINKKKLHGVSSNILNSHINNIYLVKILIYKLNDMIARDYITYKPHIKEFIVDLYNMLSIPNAIDRDTPYNINVLMIINKIKLIFKLD